MPEIVAKKDIPQTDSRASATEAPTPNRLVETGAPTWVENLVCSPTARITVPLMGAAAGFGMTGGNPGGAGAGALVANTIQQGYCDGQFDPVQATAATVAGALVVPIAAEVAAGGMIAQAGGIASAAATAARYNLPSSDPKKWQETVQRMAETPEGRWVVSRAVELSRSVEKAMSSGKLSGVSRTDVTNYMVDMAYKNENPALVNKAVTLLKDHWLHGDAL